MPNLPPRVIDSTLLLLLKIVSWIWSSFVCLLAIGIVRVSSKVVSSKVSGRSMRGVWLNLQQSSKLQSFKSFNGISSSFVSNWKEQDRIYNQPRQHRRSSSQNRLDIRSVMSSCSHHLDDVCQLSFTILDCNESRFFIFEELSAE